MNILEVKNISKSFDGKKVIDGVSFSVGEGKIVGLLGKNGSGKTTILKMINDLLTIDEGEIFVLGERISERTKAWVSFLSERNYLDGSWTVDRAFKFFEEFYPDFDRKRAESLLENLDIEIGVRLSKMSKGMKEKIQLILVMSRKAKLYVLDEPLGGVDPSTRDYILSTILSYFGEGSSMLITTHLVAEVEKILDEVIFIDQGRIVLSGSADALRDHNQMSIDQIFRRKIK
jgi:ABC-2 type transport system ATP-binding protein